MHPATLEQLRCPFCGTVPALIQNNALVRTETDISAGVLSCQCCAFPIVAGIPVMIASETTRTAIRHMERGEGEAAVLIMLGLSDAPQRAEAFRALIRDEAAATYSRAIEILSPDAEGQYFVYRFSDPTFLIASAVVRALGQHPGVGTGRVLDICGGSGHLTRVMATLTAPGQTTLVDVSFWKLWLARHFTVPDCTAVCCDANQPLPFAHESFALVVCSDAFPYIWHKRLMAEEMVRLAGPAGIVALPHLHSSLGYNVTAGMTLTPDAYSGLFAALGPRSFKDSVLLEQVLEGDALDLSTPVPDTALHGEPSLTLIATRQTDVFRSYEPHQAGSRITGALVVNPLYRIERLGNTSRLTLTFPTPEYEEEFAACKRYLPATLTVAADLTRPFDAAALGADHAELRRRHIVLDVPRRYR